MSDELRAIAEKERTARRATRVDDRALQDFLDSQFGNLRSREIIRLSVRNIHDYFCILNLQRVARSPKSAQRSFPGVMRHYFLAPTDDWVESAYFHMRNVIITRRSQIEY